MEEKKNINYSAQDIARYHSGQMSAAEMHALEKAALDDPFLADAIEGYAFSKAPEHELAQLKKALEKRTDKNRAAVVTLSRRSYALRIAAMFILLAGLGWLVLNMATGKPDKDIATIPVEKPVEDPAKSTSPVSTFSDSLQFKNTSPALTESATPVQQSGTYATIPEAKEKKQNTGVATRSGSVMADSYNDTVRIADQASVVQPDAVASNTKQQIDDVKAPVTAKSEINIPKPLNHELRGYVQNSSGQPVPFASVKVRGVNSSIVTNKVGAFKISAPDSNAVVTASAAGFETETSTLNSRSDNLIVLKENDADLSEVVVTRPAQGRKKAQSKMIIESGDLEPEDGWAQYNDYVENKLRPASEKTRRSKDFKEVALAFDVNANGEPVNITVVKSQCESCNEQAIRLLKDGPKWKQKNGRKGKIAFRF